MSKSITTIIAPPSPHMVGDGFRVHGFLTPSNAEHTSPFLLMDYAPPHEFTPSIRPRGVGAHPHRGFETVTIAFQGRIEHHDNAGNSGIIDEGEVQWMTAGKGLMHREYHEQKWSEQGGTMEMLQLWVNLPKKDKMNAPKYQAITRDMIVEETTPGGRTNVLAGTLRYRKGDGWTETPTGPAQTHSPIIVAWGNLEKGASFTCEIPSGWSTLLLVRNGEVSIQDQSVSSSQLALLGKENSELSIVAKDASNFVIMAGEPLNEPIVSYGPFVMNTSDEIRQAFDDFRHGLFGDERF